MPSWKGVGVATLLPDPPVVVDGVVVVFVDVVDVVDVVGLGVTAVVGPGGLDASTQYDCPTSLKFPHSAVMEGFCDISFVRAIKVWDNLPIPRTAH